MTESDFTRKSEMLFGGLIALVCVIAVGLFLLGYFLSNQ